MSCDKSEKLHIRKYKYSTGPLLCTFTSETSAGESLLSHALTAIVAEGKMATTKEFAHELPPPASQAMLAAYWLAIVTRSQSPSSSSDIT